MKKIITLATTIALSAVMTAQTIGNLQFGTDSTFDIMTWNIEHFPKNGQTTINYVSQAITALDLDVIAFQEINDTTLFKQMVNGLPAYAGFARLYEYAGLAFMYKTTTVEINNVYEIFTASNYSNPFPRPPFVLDFNFMNQNFIVIDNHFKCCGDGYINSADAWDEETRRLYASTLLKQYIESHFADKNVIVLGDLNDELTDNQAHNVFQPLLNDSQNFRFADMTIATGTTANWSYPSWPSHLDHILITNELFDEFEASSAYIKTIKVDSCFTSWNQYDSNISDHRPVALKFIPNTISVIDDSNQMAGTISIYPNPASTEAVFQFLSANKHQLIEIFNSTGQMVQSINIETDVTEIAWDVRNLPNGIYLAKLISDNSNCITIKMLVIK